ncbi:MAG: pyridoxamine 5'-phosphate oxidase family protein [Pelagimonas sp.]|jgi:PPOX class probable FMN-dependent enzyme|nr:pyridoxamine 5'-phosphate oxidase family protein [Pelagimonas sp.]
MRKLHAKDLSDLYGAPVPASLSKVADHLTPLYRAWIEGSRFCILSTVGAEGVRGTPRGDDGPVVRVHDSKTLLMPDWKGNNRIDALRDIVDDGRVALLFMVPGSKTTVRVNGKAWLTDDEPLRQSFARKGILPASVLVIELHEVFTQCAKALMRSGLWARDDKDTVPTVGQIMAEMTDGEYGGPDYDRDYEKNAIPRMW